MPGRGGMLEALKSVFTLRRAGSIVCVLEASDPTFEIGKNILAPIGAIDWRRR
jgi:hypothetical protein